MFIRSKIQFFESKSQQTIQLKRLRQCCLSDQRYNFLKANHNSSPGRISFASVVYQIKDTIFWKQITTVFLSSTQINGCLSDQRYNFLKANHNPTETCIGSKEVVYQIKDTIFWKQITTKENELQHKFRLFIRSKIQFFESKSQHCQARLSP